MEGLVRWEIPWSWESWTQVSKNPQKISEKSEFKKSTTVRSNIGPVRHFCYLTPLSPHSSHFEGVWKQISKKGGRSENASDAVLPHHPPLACSDPELRNGRNLNTILSISYSLGMNIWIAHYKTFLLTKCDHKSHRAHTNFHGGTEFHK